MHLTGTVTFLFTDIEGSTELLLRLGDLRYADVLKEHQQLLRQAFAAGHGHEIDTQGDAFLVAFARTKDAVTAAVAGQRALAVHAWPHGTSLRVRMGLHTGAPVSESGSYVGLDVHRAARICAAGHGGQILLSDAVRGLITRDLPPDVQLRDLGTHRLKDLKEPEHLLQVVHPDLPADFPPLRSLDARPNNLPIQLTSFIGRAPEIAEVRRLLSAARLVTLTGAGGAGKTRLALQAAADEVEGYPGGVWLAEFAPIADPALVSKTVAAALSVPEQPGRDMTETLVNFLRPKKLLLLLDNCEHLLAACSDLAAALLRTCPQLRILATSREGLGVPGETLWRVPSLSLPEDIRHLPPPEELVLYDAVRLFVDRAVASGSGFMVTGENALAIAQVCKQLDGIPLAIELAAARVKSLAVEQITARLDNTFRLLTGGSRTVLPRHQTLRAAMDWSYELLLEKERAVLRRLSVFAGGWTLEAAEAVCAGGGVEVSDVLDLLTQLVDKSLVVAEIRGGEARYGLLETVRQYARDRLMESGDAADARARHGGWYLTLAESADPKLRGPEAEVWLERLESEHDNLRAALEWSKIGETGAEAGLRLAAALTWFWFLHGYWSEGRAWLKAALARSSDAPLSVQPSALSGAAFLAWRQGDFEQAMRLGEKGLTLSRNLGDRRHAAWLLIWLGVVLLRKAEYGRALARLEESLDLSRELGDKWLMALAVAQLGRVEWHRGDFEQAAALHTESLTLVREAGDKWAIAYNLRNLGMDMLSQGDYKRAAAYCSEGLDLCRQVGDRWVAEECLDALAVVASAMRLYEKAARLFGAADALHEILRSHRSAAYQAQLDQSITRARIGLGETIFAAAWAEGRRITLEQAIEYALMDEPPISMAHNGESPHQEPN